MDWKLGQNATVGGMSPDNGFCRTINTPAEDQAPRVSEREEDGAFPLLRSMSVEGVIPRIILRG